MKQVKLSTDYFFGAISIEKTSSDFKPWRVDHKLQELFPSENNTLLNRMESTSGIKLRFTTNSPRVRLTVQPRKAIRKFDLVVNNTLCKTIELERECTDLTFENLPGSNNPIEIWLPHNCPTEIAGLYIEKECESSPGPDTRLKWLTYGSSITACANAHSPSRTWPAVVARSHNLNLTSLGYSGQCHLDPMVARMIRDQKADIITLKLGINVQGSSSLNPRTFKPAVIGLIQIIREKHPNTPIGVISPIISPPRETTDNTVGLCLSTMREEIKDAVERIQRTTNDQKLFYFDGLNVFGKELLGPRLPDELHPDGDHHPIHIRWILSTTALFLNSSRK